MPSTAAPVRVRTAVHRRVDGVSFGRSSALGQVVREAYEGNEPQALA